MAQQTAVIRLEEKLKTYLSWSSFLEEDFEQAKAMEKEQIQKAFSDGQETPINHPTLPHYSSKEYYNDTYKN